MSDLEAFRAEVRDWLAENCPASMRTPMVPSEIPWGGRNPTWKNPDSKLWMERMGEKGWTAPTWPTEYGGGGLSKEEAKILKEEMEAINARAPLFSFGLWMLGPVLLEFANEEQKKKFIPPIVKGEIRWCQGYSEPGAGSDLAGLRTSAVLEGDEWVINGQKVWTSYANYADWIFCLTRTDTSAKHDGISFILFDMTSDGVETRPIQLISGESPFCETFFDNVRVPKDHLVGEMNKGWTIAKRLLQHERTNIGDFGTADKKQVLLQDIALEYIGRDDLGRLDDGIMRDKIARYDTRRKVYAKTIERVTEEIKSNTGTGAASSIFKAIGAELNKHKMELQMKIRGSQALGWEGDGFSKEEIAGTRAWLRSKANSIEGGTTEINKNVIAKNVLGMPKS